MKIKVSDYLTHIDNDEDFRYLRGQLFDVNMRLFHSNPHYRYLIHMCCNHIGALALAEYEDYKKPHGMSGANAGIPWNIIAIVRNRGDKQYQYCTYMINPEIVEFRGEIVETESNCGSIRLEKPIKVKRWETVVVRFFNYEGVEYTDIFNRKNGSFTIQHEIDHNQGILITDRQERADMLV